MAINKRDTKVTRLDLRIPNDIYAQVEEIARANNEPSHHITGNIILSPTLIKLISLGISSLSGNYTELVYTTTNTPRVPDTLSPRVDAIEVELVDVKKLVADLSDKLSVTLSGNQPDNVTDSLSDSADKLVSDLTDTKADSNQIAQERKPKADLSPISEEVWQTLERQQASGEKSLPQCSKWILEKYGIKPDISTISRRFKKMREDKA